MTPDHPPFPIAVVTGAGNGIGRTVAHRFARDGYGVVVNDLAADRATAVCREIDDRGGNAHPHVGDVSDPASVESLSGAVRNWAGRVDVLVNNAGIGEAPLPIGEQDPARWQQLTDVLLRGPFLCSRRLGTDYMLPTGRGRIIGIASIAGTVGLPPSHAYSAAKAGLIMFTRTLACEWAQHAITVNAVAPGYIATAHLNRLIAKQKIDADQLRRRIPAGRLGSPDDVANAVAFLASTEADYITGTTLTVDGGWTAFGNAGHASASPPD